LLFTQLHLVVSNYKLRTSLYEWSVYGHWYKQTLVNSGAIKNFVKSVKYVEFLANVYSNVDLGVTEVSKIDSTWDKSDSKST